MPGRRSFKHRLPGVRKTSNKKNELRLRLQMFGDHRFAGNCVSACVCMHVCVCGPFSPPVGVGLFDCKEGFFLLAGLSDTMKDGFSKKTPS